MKKDEKGLRRHDNRIGFVVGTLFLVATFIVIRAIILWKDCFHLVHFSQMIFSLLGPMDGANTEEFRDIALQAFPWCIGVAILLAAVIWILGKHHDFFLKLRKYFWCITLVLFLGVTIWGLCQIGTFRYFYQTYLQKSKLYETEYIDPNTVELSFPEEKRNLIYIYCESMENTYMGAADGGAQEENYIPELTQLMKDNTSFYNQENHNGGLVEYNCDWTAAAMVAHSSGVPLCLPLNKDSYDSNTGFLPGITTLGDILKEAGYNQELIVGSDATFAGRKYFFETHGDFEIFDYNSAIELGYIPEDYYVWWGLEDQKLFQYAKEEILKQAEKEAPFNVTMLTVDTHFTTGYFCSQCEKEYDDNYQNVLHCSSRQLADFVAWIQEQDFYENTTIILAGDHLNMGGDYISALPKEYDRTGYFTIINAADSAKNHADTSAGTYNKNYTTMDYFPTTLAAMGVKIEGDRLGLGTNLFSQEDTLVDKYGYDVLYNELEKGSAYYKENFLAVGE